MRTWPCTGSGEAQKSPKQFLPWEIGFFWGKATVVREEKKAGSALGGESCTELSCAGGKEVHRRQQGQWELLTSHCGLYYTLLHFPHLLVLFFLISGKKGSVLTVRVQRDAGAALWLYGEV